MCPRHPHRDGHDLHMLHTMLFWLTWDERSGTDTALTMAHEGISTCEAFPALTFVWLGPGVDAGVSTEVMLADESGGTRCQLYSLNTHENRREVKAYQSGCSHV